MKGAELCLDCKMFDLHKDKCWFFWKKKKECSQFIKIVGDVPSFKRLE